MKAASFAGVSGRSISARSSASATALAMHTGVLMQLPSPTPLAPSGVKGERDLDVQHDRGGHFGRGRHEIVGEGAGQESAVGRIGIFLIDGGAERMGEAAGDLARDHAGMQHAAAVMHGDVFVDPYRAGDAVDLDPAEIEDEAVTERGIDFVLVARRRQLRRRPEHRFAKSLARLPAQCQATNDWRRQAGRRGTHCPDCRARARVRRRIRFLRPARSTAPRRRVAACRAAGTPPDARRRRPPAQSGWNNCPTRSTRHRGWYRVR